MIPHMPQMCVLRYVCVFYNYKSFVTEQRSLWELFVTHKCTFVYRIFMLITKHLHLSTQDERVYRLHR